jgi:hypothetical protein
MKAPSMQGGAFKYKEKTLECFTLSDKLPSKYNRIFMHVGEGSIFIRVQRVFLIPTTLHTKSLQKKQV